MLARLCRRGKASCRRRSGGGAAAGGKHAGGATAVSRARRFPPSRACVSSPLFPHGRNISRAIKRAEVEATPVTRKSPEKLLKFRLLEPMTVPSF
uniref:Uncharacterized protein n=1 Tax=Oryza barthii TaxID=65489 RepID=A0A0D3H750_9ORYZ